MPRSPSNTESEHSDYERAKHIWYRAPCWHDAMPHMLHYNGAKVTLPLSFYLLNEVVSLDSSFTLISSGTADEMRASISYNTEIMYCQSMQYECLCVPFCKL